MQACFDDTKGALELNHCASEASRADLEGAGLRSSHYLALGAAGALLHFLEQVTGVLACRLCRRVLAFTGFGHLWVA